MLNTLLPLLLMSNLSGSSGGASASGRTAESRQIGTTRYGCPVCSVATSRDSSGLLTVTKIGDRDTVVCGNTMTIVLDVTNRATAPLWVTLTDAIPIGSSVVPNSVTVDGIADGGSILSGIDLGPIAAGATVRVEYQLLACGKGGCCSATAAYSVQNWTAAAAETQRSNLLCICVL